MDKRTKYMLLLLVGLIIIIATTTIKPGPQAKKIEYRVASDAEKAYQIAKRNGDAMDAYTTAGQVAVAYLQAHDEEQYKRWKEIEREEGRVAGIE